MFKPGDLVKLKVEADVFALRMDEWMVDFHLTTKCNQYCVIIDTESEYRIKKNMFMGQYLQMENSYVVLLNNKLYCVYESDIEKV